MTLVILDAYQKLLIICLVGWVCVFVVSWVLFFPQLNDACQCKNATLIVEEVKMLLLNADIPNRNANSALIFPQR